MTQQAPVCEPAEILSDPAWYPLGFDWERQLVFFLRIEVERLRDLTYHDLSAAAPEDPVYGIPFDDLEAEIAAGPAGPRPFLLVHPSFSCSTLLTRCLDSTGTALCLREPLVLHLLDDHRAEVPADDRRRAMDLAVALLGRRPSPRCPAVIKLEALPLVEELVAAGFHPGIYLGIELEDFVLSVLKRSDRRDWARQRWMLWRSALRAAPVAGPLDEAVALDPEQASDAEIATLVWLVGRHCASAAGSPIFRGEDLLHRPVPTLMEAGCHLDLDADREDFEKLLEGPLFRTHAKWHHMDFDAETRRSLLDRLGALHRRDLDRARELLSRLGVAEG